MTDELHCPFPLGHGSVTITPEHGRTVQVRHIVPQDADLLIDLFMHLSPETRRLRFFAPTVDPPDDVLRATTQRLATIDPLVQAALIATIEEQGGEHAVGVARLVGDADDSMIAEVAIVLRDDYQGKGLGTLLFDLLIQVAMVRGLKYLRAISLAENSVLHKLVRNTGLPITSTTRQGETTMIISLGGS